MRIVANVVSLLALGAGLLVGAGCDNPVSPEPTPEPSTQLYDMVIAPGETESVDFILTQSEGVWVTLLAASTENRANPVTIPIGLRLGRFTATGCEQLVSGAFVPAFASQIQMPLERGSYCVEVFDAGGLPEPVAALVRVVHPAPDLQDNPQTITSASNITVGGSASIAFIVTTRGTTTIRLADVQPNVPVGLGVGVRYSAAVGCRFSHVLTTTASANPQFTLPVDPGTYCAQVFDIGNFTDTASYQLIVQRP